MKKLYFLLLLSFFLQKANAQWVTIPDANFVIFLQQNYPACMNGNQMDTTCSAIMNATAVNCNNKNISDLTGIQYFISLEELFCTNNQISSFPTLPSTLLHLAFGNNQVSYSNFPLLPSSLTSLWCYGNGLTGIPPLPNTVTTLDIRDNSISFIPSLPSSLEVFWCMNNQLTSLPTLPSTLLELHCSQNQITTLPSLPNNIWTLSCNNNQLNTLPVLPASLEQLSCSKNQLNSLPLLPATLTVLACSDNQFTSLPLLPISLIYLNCAFNQLTSLPVLPNTLTHLYCSENQLTFLPVLPISLKYLDCKLNQINSLPALPNSLIDLDCNGNQLISLPSLPSTLSVLVCAGNQLTSLPAMPPSLIQLVCPGNNLTNLPTLPNSLVSLSCYNNQLTSLPSLPSSLANLTCYNNLLTTLPNLPGMLNYLYCSNNQLIHLPELPDSLVWLDIHNNPNLNCLPQLKKITKFRYYNTGISCLPNIPQLVGNNPIADPPLGTFPLCDLFNPNGCDAYWNISGKVYKDNNSNCMVDTYEQKLGNVKLQLFQNGNLIQQTYSGGEGLYSFDTDTGTYTYTVDTTNLPVYVTCPPSAYHTSVLTPADSMEYNMDFGMQCKPGFDVGVNYISQSAGLFFPGNNATIKIGAGDMANFYGLYCVSGVSGSVIVNFTGPVTYVSAASGALNPTVIGNTLTYNISNFANVNFNSSFRFIVKTDTTAQMGDQVCFTVNVTPLTGDNDTTNNSLQHCFSVVNSFDPNAKEVHPTGDLPLDQEWLTYTVHFQNTGNAPAQHIYILDSLDNNLDASSFTLLSYSHDNLTQLFGNVIKFNFPNINLPDSVNDEPNSHGFIQYKIRLVPGLPAGTIITNTAYNFFDFNPPIATNTVTSEIETQAAASIQVQPLSTGACDGSSVTLSVSATGSNLSYQWRKNSVDLSTSSNILDVNSATLIIDPVTTADTGSYDVVITGSFGSPVTSDPAVVTISGTQVVPSASIVSNNNPVCDSITAFFIASSVNAGSNPVYEWYVNNVAQNVNNDTLSILGLQTGDQVYFELTSSEDCAVPAIVNSNTITMIVNPLDSTCIPVVSLLTPSCGLVQSDITDLVQAEQVFDANAYQYKIENTTLGYFAQPIRDIANTCCPYLFGMNMVNGLKFNTTYQMAVRARVAGVWGSYGPSCSVTTPPFPQISLLSNSCNITLTSLSQLIYSEVVYNVSNYRYLITGPNGFSVTYLRGSGANNFSLSWVNGIQYNTTYNIQVEAYVNGDWGSYGPVCTVTTPAQLLLTQLNTSSCNITLTVLSQLLSADIIPGAANYRYRITKTGYTNVYHRNSSSNLFSLGWISSIQYGETYNIEVSAFVAGAWTNYGPVCTVTTPSTLPVTQLAISSCNISINNMSDLLYSNPVRNAQDYQYRVINTVLGFNSIYTRGSGSNAFSLGWMNGIAYNATYSIEVRTNVGGTWSNYGPVCTVTTPPNIPLTQLSPQYCGAILTSMSQIISSDIVPNASNYQYHVYNTALGFNTYLNRGSGSNLFSLGWIPGIQLNETYNVEVRAYVGGAWGTFGNICNVTTPTTPDNSTKTVPQEIELISLFDFVLFPNPASSAVTIQFYSAEESNLTIKLYDIHGRLVVDQNSIAAEGINEFTFDVLFLSKGIYMVELTTDDERMMKKLIVQ